jgi:hypothetical protein
LTLCDSPSEKRSARVHRSGGKVKYQGSRICRIAVCRFTAERAHGSATPRFSTLRFQSGLTPLSSRNPGPTDFFHIQRFCAPCRLI